MVTASDQLFNFFMEFSSLLSFLHIACFVVVLALFILAWVFIKKKQANNKTGKSLLRVAFVTGGIILLGSLRPLVANHDITVSIIFLLAQLGIFYLVAIGGTIYSFTKKNG